MTLICHLARAGFSRFQASDHHSELPTQTIICTSSMKSITSQLDFSTSFRTALSLSSNSHLNFAQAMRDHISRDMIFFHFRLSGTSFSTIFLAIHSTIAVFQTQGSQIITGLFFCLLDKIWMVRLVSSSLQITGSIFHSFAISTRSMQYFLSDSYMFSASFEVTLSQCLIFSTSFL